ncbi:formate dehydrogenase accessory sulfurtransferase FdhD [Deltaproteobacteria bacterium Smac51]|nr:formate dehydrogenase accessory sulfurtransferase FdhD [Deltaproteobacteria bacterium Smac51]
MAAIISPPRITTANPMIERRIRRYKNGVFTWEEAPFADECRVDILVGGQRRASVMASPFELESLAVGFLFGEGSIGDIGDIKSLSVKGTEVFVELYQKNTASLSVTWENVETELFPVNKSCLNLKAADILSLSEDFNSHSYLFHQTGAVHSCRLIDGSRYYHADDVARHNALDKVIGQYLINGPCGGPALVLTTGRISSELLLKSAKAGIGVIISRSAATDLAVDLARRLNMVMIGFSRQGRFNVYNGGEMFEGAPLKHLTAY